MNERLINKQELKYILITGLFSFGYFILFLPWILQAGAESMNPIFQFLIFGLGVYIMFFFVFKSFAMDTSMSAIFSIVILFPIMAGDLVMPEYHINIITGELEKGATLGMASTDYFIATVWQSIGFSGYILVPLVYFVSFILLLIISALLRKNFLGDFT
jgi:hypothetical protein